MPARRLQRPEDGKRGVAANLLISPLWSSTIDDDPEKSLSTSATSWADGFPQAA